MYLRHEGYIKSFDDTELYYVKDVPEKAKAIVVIVHGFAEHLARYEYLTEKLIENNYGVYRFDNRGHGNTKSEKGYIKKYDEFIKDADTIVNLAKKENPSVPIFMLGHSMGGFIAATYGIIHPDKLKGQILSGAATTITPEVRGFKGTLLKGLNKIVPKLKIKNPISNTLCKNETVVEKYISDPLVLKEASLNLYVEFLIKGVNWLNNNMSNYNYPCLILHGSDDRIVPKEASENFYNKISSIDKKITVFEGFYHEIMNEKYKDQVIGEINAWLDERIKSNSDS